eukprot:EG_transcript_26902
MVLCRPIFFSSPPLAQKAQKVYLNQSLANPLRCFRVKMPAFLRVESKKPGTGRAANGVRWSVAHSFSGRASFTQIEESSDILYKGLDAFRSVAYLFPHLIQPPQVRTSSWFPPQLFGQNYI